VGQSGLLPVQVAPPEHEAPAGDSEQLPGVALQPSHSPAHAVSQQKPSIQNPLWQTRQPLARQSAPAAALQVAACALRGWQVALAAQKLPPVHCVSPVQLDGQDALVPVQVYGEHDGEPVDPSGAFEQVPFAVAPNACEHTSQALLHEPSQQKPSTQ
jgi:hypothetical protein